MRFRITVTYEVDTSPEVIGRACNDICGTIAEGLGSKLQTKEEANILPGAKFSIVANPRPRRKRGG